MRYVLLCNGCMMRQNPTNVKQTTIKRHGNGINITAFTWRTLGRNLGIILAFGVGMATVSQVMARISGRTSRPPTTVPAA